MQNNLASEQSGAEGAARRAILVGLELKGDSSSWTTEDSLDELAQLAATAGLSVAGTLRQKAVHPDPSSRIGAGKVQELVALAESTDSAYVLLDDEVTPGQQRKLEAALGEQATVIDRTRLVLDIFSRHAHTREGKLQVELAQHQYLLPRLAGSRTGLSRQAAGAGGGLVGLGGPGETQLEMDRRQARRRITLLRRELEELRGQRQRHRAQRESSGLPVIALVGYTNAGKSSLLNALTGAGVLVEDKLFSTLDPTTRRLELPGGREALLTDTVGFIRKLPHDLVAAFRATLEGIEEADLILHVVDGTHQHASEQVAAVEEVLAGLDTAATPRLLVWNKIDRLAAGGAQALPILEPRHEHVVAVSARRGDGIAELLDRIQALLARDLVEVKVLIPYNRYELVKLAYDQGTVARKLDDTDGVRLHASVPHSVAMRLAPFAFTGEDAPEPGSSDPV